MASLRLPFISECSALAGFPRARREVHARGVEPRFLLEGATPNDLTADAQLGVHRRRIRPSVLADALERERAIGEHDSGLGAVDVAGAVEQRVQQLFGTRRPGLQGGDVQAGGLGMLLADFVSASRGNRPRRVAIGVVEPEPLIRPVPGQIRRVQRNELAAGAGRCATLLRGHGRNHSRPLTSTVRMGGVRNDRTTKPLPPISRAVVLEPARSTPPGAPAKRPKREKRTKREKRPKPEKRPKCLGGSDVMSRIAQPPAQIERARADQIERARAGQIERARADQIERARADMDFVPSFDALLACGEPDLMREPLRGWLAGGDRQANCADAAYVYDAWLKAGGEPELIRESLVEWLAPNAATAPNATAKGASPLYEAWLNTTGEPGLVRDGIGAWVELHGDDPVAGFLYRAWLSAGGELQAFSTRICAWLDAYTNDGSEAHSLYCAWLERGGEPALVERSLQRWLAAHAQDEATGHLCAPWLTAGGEPLLIAEPAARWLGGAHAQSERAQFLYKAWLDTGGERELLRGPIERWLSVYGEGAAANFVYEAWLKAGGEPGLVRESIRGWLAAHATDRSASIVYQVWLKAGGEPQLVSEPIRDWLTGTAATPGNAAGAAHATDRSATFVYEAWLDATGDVELVRDAIGVWLAEHGGVTPGGTDVYRS